MSNINSTVNVNVDQIVQGAGKITLDGVDVGSFRDGVTVTYNESFATTRSDYAIGEIDSELIGAECSVNTTLEQSTLTNIAIALGGNTSSSSSSSSSKLYDFGPTTAIVTKELVITGMSADDKTKGRRITFFKAQRIGQLGFSFKRGAETLLPVTFKILLNSSGKFFRIEEPIPLNQI